MSITQDIFITVDGVIFTFHDNRIKILLIQRIIPPFEWSRALPWWYVLDHETLEQAAYREIKEETNVDNAYLEQLYTFSDTKRDPRHRVITCAYIALMRYEDINSQAGSDAQAVQLFDINDLPPLAFDHQDIVLYAIQRLQYKMDYTNTAQYLLPGLFTLTELYILYQTTFHKEIDIRNFKKKILKLWIIESTGKKIIKWVHRPAMLYKFTSQELQIINII